MLAAENASVPTSVTRDELNEAMEPLLRLLGVTKYDIYSDPGLAVSKDAVTFTMAAGPMPRNGRPRRLSVVADNAPQGDYDPRTGRPTLHDLHQFVSVKIYRPDEVEPNPVAKTAPIRSGRRLVHFPLLSVAWFPERHRRCNFRAGMGERGWRAWVGLGPLYMKVGRG